MNGFSWWWKSADADSATPREASRPVVVVKRVAASARPASDDQSIRRVGFLNTPRTPSAPPRPAIAATGTDPR